MLNSRFAAAAILVSTQMCASPVLFAQSYPNKPVRIITQEAGGGLDFTARLIAQNAAGFLGQPVFVDNRGGGGGVIAIESVAKAAPDGYTTLLYGSTMWLLPFMRDNVPWDPIRDFLPVTLTNRQPNVLVIHPSMPVRSVKQLITLAKARPGDLNYGSAGPGSQISIAAELFKSMAQVNIVHIPFKGSAPAIQAILSGEVHLMFTVAPSAAPHVRSGRLKPLAVSSAEPSALFPDLPTVAAGGLPGYEAVSLLGLFAPAKTPAAIINRLNQDIVRAMAGTDIKQKFFNAGSVVVGSSPDELATLVKSEMNRIGKVIVDAKIRVQ
jgi:tripartite-type tricarboxylate transporter receptor subunit TctC